jgi:hypothetical protein
MVAGMSLLRREPRAVYRVYEESEYLDGEARALDTSAGESLQAQPLSTGEMPALETPAPETPAFETSAFDAPAFEEPALRTPAFDAPAHAPAEPRSTPYLAVLLAAGLILFVAVCVAVLALHFSGAARGRTSSAPSAPRSRARGLSRERSRRERIAVRAANRPSGPLRFSRARRSAATPGRERVTGSTGTHASGPSGAHASARTPLPPAPTTGSGLAAVGEATFAARADEAASSEAAIAEARTAGGEFGFER